jgi:hypothetical protein
MTPLRVDSRGCESCGKAGLSTTIALGMSLICVGVIMLSLKLGFALPEATHFNVECACQCHW